MFFVLFCFVLDLLSSFYFLQTNETIIHCVPVFGCNLEINFSQMTYTYNQNTGRLMRTTTNETVNNGK